MKRQPASRVAYHWLDGTIKAPISTGGARLYRTTVRSGRAIPYRSGVAHHVAQAAIVVPDGARATLAAKWICGSGSVDAVPVPRLSEHPICRNCAEAARLPTGPVVYRAYDDQGGLVYIGSTTDLSKRLRNHRAQTTWWQEVSNVHAEPHPSEHEARIAESLAILHEVSFRNRRGLAPHVEVVA